MENCGVLAFLLCRRATVDGNGSVTLHDLFDGIVIPQPGKKRLPGFRVARGPSQIFYAFYKVVAYQQCRVALKVLDPRGAEIPGNWRDSLTPQAPSIWQAIWALSTSLFQVPGDYQLTLMQENDYPTALPFPLASTSLLVVGEE